MPLERHQINSIINDLKKALPHKTFFIIDPSSMTEAEINEEMLKIEEHEKENYWQCPDCNKKYLKDDVEDLWPLQKHCGCLNV